MTNTTPQSTALAAYAKLPNVQNAAHRADMLWAKVGRSEYLRSDGVTIRKNTTNNRWYVHLPNGDIAAMVLEGVLYRDLPAAGHSLMAAKYEAESITVNTPSYIR